MARAIQTDDPTTLKKREQTRLRVQRHREKKAKQEAFGEALEDLAALEPESKPSRARSKQALLKGVLAAEGVTVRRIVATRAQALSAVKVRQVGDEMVEMPAWQERLRACEQLDKDLQRAGEMPDDKASANAGQQIIVTILSFSDSGEPVSRPALPLVPDDVRTLTAAPVAKARRDHVGSARGQALAVRNTQYELPKETA